MTHVKEIAHPSGAQGRRHQKPATVKLGCSERAQPLVPMGKGSQPSTNVLANQPLRDWVIAALVDFKDAWSWLEQSRITISKHDLPVQD